MRVEESLCLSRSFLVVAIVCMMLLGTTCDFGYPSLVQASSGPIGGMSPYYIVVNASMTSGELANSIDSLKATGGVVYFTGGGSTYDCPPFPPNNVSYVTGGSNDNAQIMALSFEGVTSSVTTQVKFECPNGWTGSDAYNTKLSGGITIDFQNSGNGLILIDAQENDWSGFTLANCGSTTTPCFQLLSAGGGSPKYNTALNKFSNYAINPITSAGEYATGVFVAGSGANGASYTTDNVFEHGLIVGNILCGFEFEANSDTNVAEYQQMFEMENSLPASASVCLNLSDPTQDIDADGILFHNLFVTGTFAYPLILGQSSSNEFDFTDQVYQNVHVIGGAPLFSVKSDEINSGFGSDLYRNGRIAVAASGVLPPISKNTFKTGDGMFARSTTSGCIFLGAPGSGPMLCGGQGAPTMSCVVGSQYYRSDGSASTLRYSCEASNTWIAVGP